LKMHLHTTEPGLQFYDGHKLNLPVHGTQNAKYNRNAGLCLEPQFWPDSPNNPEFPNATLKVGEIYTQTTIYEFDFDEFEDKNPKD
ncbi:MAG: hypothetical protein R3261_12690, partial [Alphaproteobacteria bacterium]|nr:hypothetical protein [Alphaproteobacteria bacterium]